MLPLRDELPTRSRAWVTQALVVANLAILVWVVTMPEAAQVALVERWSVVPARLLGDPGPGVWATLFTSLFLHAGWAHLLGNLLMLWIFGNNVEDRLGHLRFIGFYLACGVAADFAQVWSDPASTIPSLGASGAIAGVLAAYLLWYPRAAVTVLVPILILPWLVRLPALVVIGLWFVLQLTSALQALDPGLAGAGGVAWFAHIGGFVAGLVLGPLLAAGRRR